MHFPASHTGQIGSAPQRSSKPALAALGVMLLATAWLGSARAMDRAQAVKLSRAYLASDDDVERGRLAEKLAKFEGEIEPVLTMLRARSYETVKAGYLPEENFSVPELLEKHPDDLLYFTVPEGYHPNRATGLVIFLHGGGSTTSRRAPRYCMDFPDEEEEDSNQLGDLFSASGMIAVGPSAPCDDESDYRWCLEESDEYLADVVAECTSRFSIDPDRVFLIGHSMGGFGAYHHIQRQPDRFAAVAVNSGSWSLAYLPMIRGTPLYIVHGIHDARAGQRWHYTDIRYARWTDKLLSQKRLDHTYFEHDGEHAVCYGKGCIARFLQSAQKLRRDPYYPHVVLASPVGFKRSFCFPVVDNRWLTLNETVDGTLKYDELLSNGEDDFDSWRLAHYVSKRRGAAIDATNQGDNTIVVTTRNVASFTVWLHPRMIDVEEPVTLVVNGETRFSAPLKPSLLTALESYQRRGDWGLVYSMKIELAEPDSQE